MTTTPTTQPVEYLIEDEDGAPFPDEFQRVAWDLIHRREAEARDASGLLTAMRPWLVHGPLCPGTLEGCDCGLVRAALAPPEPRWPSEQELADAMFAAGFDGDEDDGNLPAARSILRHLAALREGGERP